MVLRAPRASDLDKMLAFANQLVDEKKTNRRLMVASFDRRIARAEEARFLKGLLAGMRRKEMLACVALAGGELVGLCTLKRGGPGGPQAHGGPGDRPARRSQR